MPSDKEIVAAVKAALSPARISTYEAIANPVDESDPAALVLYAWNAEVSGSLLAELHVWEVVMRNAVSAALEAVHGANWPWTVSFERSLPSRTVGYNPRRDLQGARRNAPTTGKVIPEVKMVFWQTLLTSRYDVRLWNPHLKSIFPHAPAGHTVESLREEIYQGMEQLRKLRNRIAHHEPILTRNLQDDQSVIFRLIGYRSPLTAAWLTLNGRASSVIAARP